MIVKSFAVKTGLNAGGPKGARDIDVLRDR